MPKARDRDKDVISAKVRNDKELIDVQILKKRPSESPDLRFYPREQNSLVQFSRSVMSDSLQPHESQHTRPPCPSPTPGVHSDSRPLSQ